MWIKTQTGGLMNLDNIVAIGIIMENNSIIQNEDYPWAVGAVHCEKGQCTALARFATENEAIEYRDKVAKAIGAVSII